MFCPAPGFSYCSVLPLSPGTASGGSHPLPLSNLPQLCTPAPHTPPIRFHSTRVSFWKPLREGSGSHTVALPSHKDRYHVPQEGGRGNFGGRVRKTLPIPAGVPESLIVTGDTEKTTASEHIRLLPSYHSNVWNSMVPHIRTGSHFPMSPV